MSSNMKLQVYKRADGKHDWRLVVSSDIVATSGNQGYESPADALRMGEKVIRGMYENAAVEIIGPLHDAPDDDMDGA